MTEQRGDAGSAPAPTNRPAQSKTSGTRPKGKRSFGVAIVVLVLGLLLLIPGLVTLGHQIALATHSAGVTATVVGYDRYADGGKNSCNGWGYDPKVSFTTAKGQRVTATVSNLQICTAPVKGSTLRVTYDTNDPSNAQIVNWVYTWGIPLAAAIVGALFAAAGVRGFFRRRVSVAASERKRRSDEAMQARILQNIGATDSSQFAQKLRQDYQRTHPDAKDPDQG